MLSNRLTLPLLTIKKLNYSNFKFFGFNTYIKLQNLRQVLVIYFVKYKTRVEKQSCFWN